MAYFTHKTTRMVGLLSIQGFLMLKNLLAVAEVAQQLPQTIIKQQVNQPVAQKSFASTLQQIKGKKLHCQEMVMLDTLLAATPTAIVRMDMVCQSALKVAQEVEKANVADEKAFCAQQIKFIMAPVRQFFGMMNDYAGMVTPLVAESLLVDQKRNPNGSLILGFFDSKMNVDDFFLKHVTTKQQLMDACSEFIIFFADIKASLSERALKAHAEKLEELKKANATKKTEDSKKAVELNKKNSAKK